MARLLSWPAALGFRSVAPSEGPRTIGAGGGTTVGNFQQSVATPFRLLRYAFNFAPRQGANARRIRGWMTALHGGANATRIEIPDPDRMSATEAGGSETTAWNSGEWAEGAWGANYPDVAVAAAAAQGATIIQLADTDWGHQLDLGDAIGFMPFHFGRYEITEVIEEGRYRIDLPLRKAITTDDFATLFPVLAMRPSGEGALSAARDLTALDGLAADMIEVPDYTVRDYFAD